jgi:hypothetical protein
MKTSIGNAQEGGLWSRRTPGTGACAGSCDDLSVTEEQITIRERARDPHEKLGEAERPLFFRSRQSPIGEQPSTCDASPGRGRDVLDDTGGAVFVEFLIAFLPVFTFFLCLIQLGLLFAVREVTEHAATTAARAAAVVIGDDPKRYGDEAPNQLDTGSGKRYDAIYRAAMLTVAPFILDGTIRSLKIEFPKPDAPEGDAQTGTVNYAPMDHANISKVRVRVSVEANCKIGLGNWIACDYFFARLGVKDPALFPGIRPYPTRTIRAEGMFPYQGASYAYP